KVRNLDPTELTERRQTRRVAHYIEAFSSEREDERNDEGARNHDHAYTGGGDLASPPCLPRCSHIFFGERRYQPNLRMAEGHRSRRLGRLGGRQPRRLHRVTSAR